MELGLWRKTATSEDKLRNAESEMIEGVTRRWGDFFKNGSQEAECRRQMAESDDGEIGRNGDGENLKLRNSKG
jgi:hypothetical protein